MNKIGTLSALAVAMAAGTAMGQGPQLEFRLSFAGANNNADGSVLRSFNTAGQHTVSIILEGRVNRWQQLQYAAQTGTGTSAVTSALTIGTNASARSSIGWAILGINPITTESSARTSSFTHGALTAGQRYGNDWDGNGQGGLDPDEAASSGPNYSTRLTSDPTWQSDTGRTTTSFGWTRFLRAGTGAQGENTPGNGVPFVIGGNLALIGDGPDSDGTGPDVQNPSVSVSDLNLSANLAIQGTSIGLNGTGATTTVGTYIPLYVMTFTTNDMSVARDIVISTPLGRDAQSNPIAGLYFTDPNGGAAQGQATNEQYPNGGAINSVTIHIDAVPAPGAAALLGLGGLLVGRRRRA